MKNLRPLILITIASLLILLTSSGIPSAGGTDDIASRVDTLFADWDSDDGPGAAVAVIR